jgi:predicted acylesterase/phospholipase RssA
MPCFLKMIASVGCKWLFFMHYSFSNKARFVCSIRADLRSLICFRNYPASNEMDLEPKIWEAALTTSAATTFFNPVTIGICGQEFVDGGAGQNNPIQEAFDSRVLAFPSKAIEFVISIGCGESADKAFGKNLKQVGETLISIATDTDDTFNLFARIHPDLKTEGTEARLFRFQVDRGMEDVGLAEYEKTKTIAAATQAYMQSPRKRGTQQLEAFKRLIQGDA